jgi:hypothetical protein
LLIALNVDLSTVAAAVDSIDATGIKIAKLLHLLSLSAINQKLAISFGARGAKKQSSVSSMSAIIHGPLQKWSGVLLVLYANRTRESKLKRIDSAIMDSKRNLSAIVAFVFKINSLLAEVILSPK